MPDGRLHLDLDAFRELLLDDLGRPLEIVVDQPLKPANARLMAFLGVRVEVRPVSDSPVDHVRRPGMRGRTMGHYAAGYELPVVEAGKPDWIDYRASVGRAERRLEAGELVSRCWSCKTELDVAAPVHSPRCRRNGTDGREALDAMDGLVSQAELLDDQADDESADVSLKPLPVSPPALEEPKPEEEVEMRGGVVKWTREQIIEAIQAFHAAHGRPPKANEWIKSAPDHPTQSTVVTHFGSWANGIEAAGYKRPGRGGVAGNSNRSSVREPKAREAGVLVSPPPADVKQPGATGDAAVLRESPSSVAAEAGSRTDDGWVASLGIDIGRLRAEIDHQNEISIEASGRRDALQAIVDALEYV